MSDQNEPEKSQQPAKKGYGKMTKTQWILLYIVIAIIVYGLIYFLFIHNSSSSGGSSGTTRAATTALDRRCGLRETGGCCPGARRSARFR